MKTGGLFRKIALTHIEAAFMAAVLTGALFLYLSTRYLADSAQGELQRTARLADALVRRDLGNAALMSDLLSESVSIRSGRGVDPGLRAGRLRRELNSTDADFISVADRRGVVVAHEQRFRPGGLPAESHIGEPLFLSRAFRRCVSGNTRASDVESIYPNTIAVVAVAPIHNAAGNIDGFLRLGYRLDDRFARNIRRYADLEVVIAHRGAIIASTLRREGEELDPGALRSGYLTISHPLGNSGARLIVASPRSRIARIQRQESLLVLAVMAAAFAVASLIGLRLTTRFTVPLGQLLSGIRRIEDGDLSHSLPHLGDDEVGDLAKSFNRMTGALQRRDEELRRHQEQLIQSGKLAAIGELAAGIAHEIGNPLAAVSGYIQLLRGHKPDTQAAHYLDVMEKEVGFIDEVIRELLDFARPSHTEAEDVSLNEATEEALRILSFHKTASELDIVRTPSASDPRIRGSRREILQAVLNLTINAMQAMPAGGRLEVLVAANGEHPDAPSGSAAIIVTDTGVGIPPDILQRIFDPFFTTKPGGAGLGLSITYRIVERHNGVINVRNREGGGTVFTIVFPLTEGGQA